VGEGTTLTEFGPQLAQDLGQHWGDYELISEGEITLGDRTPAYEIVFSGTMEGYTLKAKYGIVIQETQAFFIMGFSMPARFEQDEAVLDEVIHSFHLELPAPEVVVGEEEPTIAAPRLQNPVTLDGGISGGNNDVTGQSGWASGWYTYEMRKPLNSGDTSGYDIAISPGDTILSSSCYWDAGETTEHSADAGSFYIELEA